MTQTEPQHSHGWLLDKRATVGVAAVLALLVVVGVGSQLAMRNAAGSVHRVIDTYELLQALDELHLAVVEAETGQRGYLLTGDRTYLDLYHAALPRAQAELADLRSLTADTADEQRRFDAVEALLKQRLSILQEVLALKDAQAVGRRLQDGGRVMGDLRVLLREVRQAEMALLQEQSRQAGATTWWLGLTTGGASLLAPLVAAGAVLLVNRNLARRRRVESALRSREQGYRLLFEHAHDAILIADEQGRYVDANGRAEELTGYGRAELLQRQDAELAPVGGPELGRRLYGELARREWLTGESVLLRKDGTNLPVEFAAGRVGEKRFQILFRDITQRKQEQEALRRSHSELSLALAMSDEALKEEAEARRAASETLQAVFQASPLAVVAIDLEGRVRLWNPAAERLFGWSEREVQGLPYPLVAADKQAEYREHFARLLRGESLVDAETQRQRKDGSRLDVSISAAPLRGPGGDISGTLIVLTDIGERKHLEQQVLQAQKMEVVGQLAGGIAHDFNNLLTVINGFSEMLLMRIGEKDPCREPLKQILRAGERAAGLTHQLLAFSRKQVIQPQILDLNVVVREVEKMLGRLIGEDVELVTELAPGLGKVKADPGQLQQVLLNLAVNARDAMPQGGQLTLETRSVELDEGYANTHYQVTPGRYALLAVSDTGHGMTEEVRRHIFEPFFTTKEVGKGTGLGLATVYGIVKQAGGHVEVYSEPGRGTTFKVYLPIANATGQALGAAPDRPVVPRGTETVLLVEDEPNVRQLAREVLRGYGYTVLEAASGDEALRLAGGHGGRIDVLVTDVVMPGLSGPAAARKLQEQRPGLKVLFLSGYTDTTMLRRGELEAGADFLLKPYSPIALADAVRAALDGA